jgi:pyruvate/2-oxoglutarate dehydrogenase complex dihydrolipoamide acyltransferase (E2) component
MREEKKEIFPHKEIPLKGIRGVIARSLSEAWKAPRVAQGIEVNMSRALALVEQLRQECGEKVTVTHVLLKAVSSLLTEFPELNGIVGEKNIEHWSNINLGVAVNTVYGVVVPVIKNAHEKNILELLGVLKQKASLARDGKLPASDYQLGSFTVSTLGMTGIDWFTPVLNAPQIAIIGVGRVVDKPVAVKGEVKVCPAMTLTLVFDHRALDGYQAGLFLAALGECLENMDMAALM